MATRRRLPSSKRSAPITRFKSLGDVKDRIYRINNRVMLKKRYGTSVAFAQRKPFTSFFIALGILLLLILLGSTIFRTKSPVVKTRSIPKNVTVHNLGASPRVNVQGSVIKAGVVKIVAQVPGIVSSINTYEGEWVGKGKVLINLSSNYQGGNAFSLSRQLAGVTYKNTKESYDTQKDLIQKQRDLANLQSTNTEELRKLTQLSVDDTRAQVRLNNEILGNVRTNLQTLRDNNGDPAQIQALQQLQSQIQGGIAQLEVGLRVNDYQVNPSNAPVELEKIGKDIALKQLDLQERALNMGLEVSKIQLKLASVQEATMYPASPFGATVQKVHVKIGDSVSPGAPLVTLSGDSGDIVIDAKVPRDIALKISQIDKSVINADEKKIEMVPTFISTEATSGQLYSVLFTLPEEYKKYFTDSAFVSVSLPVGQSLQNTVPFIPVDAVFQTQDEAFVFVVNGNKAKSKKIKLGEVTGGFVTVDQGLLPTDRIILNRTVIDDEPIRIQN